MPISSVIDREFIIDAPFERVWPILRDIPRAAECAPGTKVGEEISPGVYRAQLGLKFGPFKLGWDATLTVERLSEEEHSAEFVIRGDPGSPGGSMSVRVSTDAAPVGNQTRIRARNVMEVDGAAAKLGQAMIETAASGAIDRFEANLTALVK